MREAISLFRWVASQPRRNASLSEEGAVNLNLAGALSELWFAVLETAEGIGAWEESRMLLAQAAESFERSGEEDRLQEVRRLERRLADSRPRGA